MLASFYVPGSREKGPPQDEKKASHTHEVSPSLDDAMRLLPVLGASVELEQPLVLLRLLLGVVGVDVPHAKRFPEVLEGEVGPHPDGDLMATTTKGKTSRSMNEEHDRRGESERASKHW